MENFGKFITFILIMVASALIHGAVLVQLWEWFIVPTFNMSPLLLVQSMGIVLTINYVKRHKPKTPENFWKEVVENMIFIVISAVMVLTLGWITNQFM